MRVIKSTKYSDKKDKGTPFEAKEIAPKDFLSEAQLKNLAARPTKTLMVCMLYENGTFNYFTIDDSLLFKIPGTKNEDRYINDPREQWVNPSTGTPILFYYAGHCSPISRRILKIEERVERDDTGKIVGYVKETDFFNTTPGNIAETFEQQYAKALMKSIQLNKFLLIIFVCCLFITAIVFLNLLATGIFGWQSYSILNKAFPG